MPQFNLPKEGSRPDYMKAVGAVVGAHVLTFPFVVLKTRAQLGYTTNFQALRDLGVTGTWRGFTPFLYGAGIRGFVQSAVVGGSPNDPKKSTFQRYLSLIVPLALGVIVGVPVENAQTKLIHDVAANPNKTLTSTGAVLLDSYKAHGIKGIYRGLLPQTTSLGIFYFVQLLFFQPKKNPTFGDMYYRSILPATIVASLITNPFEVVKTRLQGLDGHQYQNIGQAIRKDGIPRLFTQGLLPFTLRNISFSYIIMTLLFPKF